MSEEIKQEARQEVVVEKPNPQPIPQPITPQVQKSYDPIEDGIRAKEAEQAKELERQKALNEEAGRISYLQNIKTETIKDPIIRSTIEDILSHDEISNVRKCNDIKRLIIRDRGMSYKDKINEVGESEVNPFFVKIINAILKYDKSSIRNLTDSQIAKAYGAFEGLDSELERANNRLLAKSFNVNVGGKPEHEMTETERIINKIKQRADSYLTKQGSMPESLKRETAHV